MQFSDGFFQRRHGVIEVLTRDRIEVETSLSADDLFHKRVSRCEVVLHIAQFHVARRGDLAHDEAP